MRIVVLGAGSQLANDILRTTADWSFLPFTHAEVDICDFAHVRKRLGEVEADAVINTAAFHRVDECEDEPEKAFWVNSYAVRNLAQSCEDLGCTLVHFSTDYVFGGEKRLPYTEDDPPHPLNVYGVSKLAGEYFVESICSRHFVVRSSGLYGTLGSRGKGGTFVETMIRLAREGTPIRVVNDQVMAPTYTKDLAQKIIQLMQTRAYGLYHITNSGGCSWYEFAKKIFELTGLNPNLVSTTTAAYGAKARRPAYSVLAHKRLKEVTLNDLRPWSEALEAYLQEEKGSSEGGGPTKREQETING